MARTYETHMLVSPVDDAHQQTVGDSVNTILLAVNCVAVVLGARTQSVAVVFDNTTPSATNGIVIVAGAQPVYIPLGYHAEGNHNLKSISLVAGGLLDVLQLS